MAITSWEAWDSRETDDPVGDGNAIKRKWYLKGASDDAAIHAGFLTVAPSTYRGLQLQNVSVKPIGMGPAVGDWLWEGVATYGDPEDEDSQEKPDVGETVFSFDTTGATTKITQGVGPPNPYSPGQGIAPDFGGAIGVHKDRVEGVDITIPKLNFTIRKVVPGGDLTLAYVKMLARITGTINENNYLGFKEGELLFMGATGQEAFTAGNPEVTFHFMASENLTDLQVGDITVTSKPGHDYLWVLYEDQEDDAAKKLVQKPLAAYVHPVYKFSDFSELGLE